MTSPTRHARRARRTAGVLSALGLALTVGACTPPAPDAVSDDPAPDTSELARRLDAAIERLGSQDVHDAETVRVQESIATCMAAKGWEYTPDLGAGAQTLTITDIRGGLSDRDFAATYGYGITSSPDAGDVFAPVPSRRPDPNKDYVASLSAAERAAYTVDLVGDQSERENLTADDEVPLYDPETAGCEGAAQAVSVSSAVEKLDASHADLFVELEAARVAARTAPEVLRAVDAWAACMADAGHPEATDPATVSAPIQQAMDDLEGGAPGGAVSSPELDALKKREIATALADLDCEGKVRYNAIATAALIKAETDFYAANRSRVEAYLADAESLAAELS